MPAVRRSGCLDKRFFLFAVVSVGGPGGGGAVGRATAAVIQDVTLFDSPSLVQVICQLKN